MLCVTKGQAHIIDLYIIINQRIISKWGGYLPAYADSALSCLIFYVIGMVLRSKNILNTLQINKMTIGLAFVGGCIITLFSHRIFIAHNYYEHPLLFHAASFGGITFLLTLCRIIGRIPLITSIYGRYSLIVLGTHALLIYPVRRFSITFITGDIGSIVTFIVVAMAEIAVVPLFIRLFPYVCAQKSIFDYLKSKNSTLIS